MLSMTCNDGHEVLRQEAAYESINFYALFT